MSFCRAERIEAFSVVYSLESGVERSRECFGSKCSYREFLRSVFGLTVSRQEGCG
jgi:hypothetical protein